MNRKLQNTVTALVATTGLLVLSLMASNPVMAPAPTPAESLVQARHAAEAAKRIEARAAQLEARLSQIKDNREALGEIAGFAAEAATAAAIAAAFDQAEAIDPAATTVVPQPRKRARGRQSVAMPFFSFAPRG
jgi:hypothetical protein